MYKDIKESHMNRNSSLGNVYIAMHTNSFKFKIMALFSSALVMKFFNSSRESCKILIVKLKISLF